MNEIQIKKSNVIFLYVKILMIIGLASGFFPGIIYLIAYFNFKKNKEMNEIPVKTVVVLIIYNSIITMVFVAIILINSVQAPFEFIPYTVVFGVISLFVFGLPLIPLLQLYQSTQSVYEKLIYSIILLIGSILLFGTSTANFTYIYMRSNYGHDSLIDDLFGLLQFTAIVGIIYSVTIIVMESIKNHRYKVFDNREEADKYFKELKEQKKISKQLMKEQKVQAKKNRYIAKLKKLKQQNNNIE
ncbi:Uncharacterised protein [Acholeplasma oculi]|uniref:Uncharacterized protein n=1 Tax=Acholeplasma oculi TaxID=35623 RepID=A0A061ABP0_9MOLU|nr:hypothetical protein [Acholeplasma oculi]CDR31218.1 hypothetical protein Aocu_11450 [Acholeplasma oculi]SKC38080.1 hypothetical protein SAMN02745122_0577 [Acholeplasma oculi]SUT91229.1 Uncharacterised protein [Acholeplasma oculi]